MDTLDGMPVLTVPPRTAGRRIEPARVEPLIALQQEFDAIDNALTREPTEDGIRLAQAHVVSLERNLNAALSMYPIQGSNGESIPNLQIKDGYIDPTIADLFRVRCKEVIAGSQNAEVDGAIRRMLRALQERVQEIVISILDAVGIMDEMDDYRETLQQAIEGKFEGDLKKIAEMVSNARRFMERVNGCKILPMDYQINTGLLAAQLAQLEDSVGVLF